MAHNIVLRSVPAFFFFLLQVVYGFRFMRTEVDRSYFVLRPNRGRCGAAVSSKCPSSDGHSAGPPLVFDNNDSVDNVHILTIGPSNSLNLPLPFYSLNLYIMEPAAPKRFVYTRLV